MLLLFLLLIFSSPPTFEVTKVVDGDTIWVADGSEKGVKIRLIGIDAPESQNRFTLKKEPYGVEAKKYLQHLLKNKRVRLTYDVDKIDPFGRTLAYVYLEDGTFLNAHLVAEGYAQVYTVPPNVKHQELFLQLQRKARTLNKGLWGVEN